MLSMLPLVCMRATWTAAVVARLRCRRGERAFAYLAIWGAISLQGPHHVANQSTTTTGFLAMVSLKPAALEGTTKTHGQYRGTRIGR